MRNGQSFLYAEKAGQRICDRGRESGRMKKRLYLAAVRLRNDIKAYRIFILAFLLYDMLAQLLFHAFCPMVIVTGLPCPGCGMTRAVFYFAAGQLEKGWRMNPLGILWLALAVYFVLMRYWLQREAKGVLQIGGVLAACMLVYYGYRMYRYFPGEVPIAYTQGNLMESLLPGYRETVLWLAQR